MPGHREAGQVHEVDVQMPAPRKPPVPAEQQRPAGHQDDRHGVPEDEEEAAEHALHQREALRQLPAPHARRGAAPG